MEADLAVSTLLFEMNTEDFSEKQNVSTTSLPQQSPPQKNTSLTSPQPTNKTLQLSNPLASPPQRKLSIIENIPSVIKPLSQQQTTDLLVDEEPNRLQIAEDIVLNENSVDSDVFHSAGDDDMLETVEAAVSSITNDQQSSISSDSILKSSTHLTTKLNTSNNSGSLLNINIGMPTIIEPKPVPSIVEVAKINQLPQFSASDYNVDENKLTIDLNENEQEAQTKKPLTSFLSAYDNIYLQIIVTIIITLIIITILITTILVITIIIIMRI